MNIQKKRILWIDGLKLFAILLVVWGHVHPRMQFTTPETKYIGVAGWIYSFHMPLFMILSGYVSNRIMKGQGDVVRKFRQLIVPCITLSIICFLIRFDENFWYLKSLFLCYIIWLGFFKWDYHYRWAVLFVACLVLFPMICHIPYLGSYKVDFMLPFFGLGILLNRYQGYVKNNLRLIVLVSGLLFVTCELIWNPQYVWYNSTPNWIDYKELIVNHNLILDANNLYMNFFRYFTGTVASLFFICLFQILYCKPSVNPVLFT